MKTNRKSGSYAGWLALAFTFMIAGWGGIYYWITHMHPTAWARLVFGGLWGMALLGTAWPVMLALNQRIAHTAPPGRIWRQSGWLALFGLLAAWLQMNRALTPALGVTIAGILGLLELLFVLRAHEATRHQETNHDE